MEYFPPLNELISIDKLPDFLSGIQGGLSNLLSNIKLKEYQVISHSNANGKSWYLVLRTSQRIDLDVFGTGLKLIFNPSFDPNSPGSYTDIPLSCSFKLPILDRIDGFNFEQFSWDLSAFFDLIMSFIDADDKVFTESIVRNVIPDSEIQNIVNEVNAYYSLSPSLTPTFNGNIETDVETLIEAIESHQTFSLDQKDIIQVFFEVYVLNASPPIPVNEFIEKAFSPYFNRDAIKSIKQLLIPEIDASISISAGLEFPREYLVPIDVNNEVVTDASIKTLIIFNAGEFRFNTKGIIGFSNPIVASFPPTYPKAQIGKTGLTIGFSNAKLDLSRDKNIPEALADGRPDDFIGVFIETASIGLPAFWLKDSSSTAEIKGRNLLIGTGGFSGSIGLDVVNGSILKTNLGSSNGFSISLDAFDITFQQNAIISSNIHGTMKIPGFKDTTGADAEINIDVWIGTNGEFSVTASEDQGITALRIPNILDVTVKSLSVGRKEGRFYVALSGALEFQDMGGFIGQFLPDKIEVQKLLIWQDGQIEYEGGTLVLPSAVTLKVGPVELSVTAIGFGSHEQEHEGQLRKYKFFEFSGGISVNPGGVDARGDGIKFYYTVDNDSNAGRAPHRYVRIQGIGIDIIIPGSADASSAALLLSGYLAMKDPKPGNEQAGAEYAGSITFSLPRLKMGGSAAMRLNPKVPAFIVDTELELSTPLLLGSTGLGIYGFRGLLGQRYVATKSAAGVPEDGEWWQYYKSKIAPDYREGIQVSKFDQTNGFSLGAGVSFATAMDGGRIFSSKLFFLLSLPEVFLLQGQGQILKDRIGLDTTSDPPFFALLSISKTSIEAAFGVDYLLPDDERPGSIARVNALIEMGFFFGNSSAWYLNIGKDLPESRRVNVRLLELFDAYFYFMLSSSGIRAGAGAKFELNKKFGPLRAELGAYLDVAGKIAFKPKQYGASIQLGGKVGLYIFKFGFAISVDAGLAGEAPRPFIVTGSLKVCIKILRKDFCAKFEFSWVKQTALHTEEIALITRNSAAKALNIQTQESFSLYSQTGTLSSLTPSQLEDYTIPMDSYIDIEFLKGVLPSSTVQEDFGGNTQGAKYVDYVSPQKAKSPRIRHEYSLEEVSIYMWDGSAWKPYDIYEAATPLIDAPFVTSDLTHLKKGYWQHQHPKLHNKLRIMAQSPLSFVSQGTGDVIVEELGITSESIFCPPEPISKTCLDFSAYGKGVNLVDTLGTIPSGEIISYDQLLLRITGSMGRILYYPDDGFNNALAIENGDTLEVLFKDSVTYLSLRMKTEAPNVTVRYYKREKLPNLTPGNLPQYEDVLVHTENVSPGSLTHPVVYDDLGNPIDKVVIDTAPCRKNEGRLICGWKRTREAEDLERFLDFLVHKSFSYPIELYPQHHSDFNGVFQGTSLYPSITSKELVLTASLTFNDDFSLRLTIADNLGFTCFIHLSSSEPINWSAIKSFQNLRPLAPQNGTDYGFKVDAVLSDKHIVTLQGESCYPILHCMDSCSLLLYQLCYLSFDDASYNAALPDEQDVQDETDALIEGFNKSLQPIWRPNSYFALEIKTEDRLFENSEKTSFEEYNSHFIYGFRTQGPIGFFHQDNATYQALLAEDREFEFKLSSLQHYVDFEKSYPNADGSLLLAKPLFYDAPKLYLFYLKNYVYEFYRNWDEYKNNEEVEISLLTSIEDPAPDTTLPEMSPIAVSWEANTLPGFMADALQLDNMITHGAPCVDTESISPMGVHSLVAIDRLKPLKLYTAIFKARYKTASESEYREEEVHRYVFQTSRYESFQEQVNSYVLERDEEDPQIITKTACFTVPVTVDSTQLSKAGDILEGTLDEDSPLRIEYANDYDKLISGVFQLETLHPAQTTEFNLIKDTNTGNLLGVLIRNPEPFNDPKIPSATVNDTVEALLGSNELDKKLFSKDRRSVFLSNAAMNVPSGVYDFEFKYLQWNGVQYEVKEVVALDIEFIVE